MLSIIINIEIIIIIIIITIIIIVIRIIHLGLWETAAVVVSSEGDDRCGKLVLKRQVYNCWRCVCL